jgi:hypothetical protein
MGFNNISVSFHYLSKNPNAIYLLDPHLKNVYWLGRYLSKNPNAIHILEKNLDKVDWAELSQNPNAIHILERNLDKVHWGCLSSKPNAIHLLAPLDTVKMRSNCKGFAEELVKYVFHPIRLQRLCDEYSLELDEYFEMV